jgi:hypothetical protein
MAQRLDPTCDVCGTQKEYRQGIGSYCPNANCGGTLCPETIVADTPPADGHFVKLGSESVQVVLEENLRAKTTLKKVEAIELYGILADGTERRLTGVKLQVKAQQPDRRQAPTRTTGNGVQLRLASREGVAL